MVKFPFWIVFQEPHDISEVGDRMRSPTDMIILRVYSAVLKALEVSLIVRVS